MAPTATRTAPTPDAADAAGSALSRCVGDPEQFLTAHFDSTPFVHRGAAVGDLLTMADVDEQLTGAGLRRPAVRVVRDGEAIDPARWTRAARTGSARIDDLVHPGRLLALFDEGCTVVLQSLQRWWPPLTAFCAQLGSALGHPVQANAYLTPAGAAGLAPHHDTHDVFVVQVHGTKHWTVREPLVEAPLTRHRSDHDEAARQPVVCELDLRPGDCLYLPRGFVHSAATQTGASLHLTLGVLAATVHDVVRRLVERAAEEPTFRRTLRRTEDVDGDDRTTLKEVAAELVSWLERFDADELSDDEVRTTLLGKERRPPALGGQLLDMVALDAVDDDTVVTRRSSVAPDVRVVGDVVSIDGGDRHVELPAPLRVVVAGLLDGGEHRVSSLAGSLDGPSRLVLVRRLVHEGLLRTVHGP